MRRCTAGFTAFGVLGSAGGTLLAGWGALPPLSALSPGTTVPAAAAVQVVGDDDIRRTAEASPRVYGAGGIEPSDMLSSLARFALLYVDGDPEGRTSPSSSSSAAAPPPSSSWRDVATRLAAPSNLEADEVVRVLDGGNAVKLRRGGVVRFGAVRTPSGYGSAAGGGGMSGGGGSTVAEGGIRLPDCLDRSPAYAARKFLPPGTAVGVWYLDAVVSSPSSSSSSSGGGPRPAVLVRSSDSTVINLELVRAGFARPSLSRGQRDAAERAAPGWTAAVEELRAEAQERGVGIYARCDDADAGGWTGRDSGAPSVATARIDLDAQFEPMDAATAIQWGADGGKPVLVRSRKDDDAVPPPNPGDTKGCSDFATYEDALRWYERYAPYYGDVARLDRDGDGVPCPGLPHTKDKERYRMKVPRRGDDKVGGAAAAVLQ